MGIPAPASTPEFLVKLLGERYRLDLVSAPYRGSAPMIGDMLGNQIAAGVGSVPDFLENHKAGKIRIVAVLGRPAAGRAAGCTYFRRTGPEGLRGSSLLRLLCTGRHAR